MLKSEKYIEINEQAWKERLLISPIDEAEH